MKLVQHSSSFIIALPVVIINLILCLIAAVTNQLLLAGALLFFLLMALISRLWAKLSLKGLSVRVKGGESGLFPGETTDIEIEVTNDKAMPVIWAEVVFPLAANLCIVPDAVRTPEFQEVYALTEAGMSAEKLGEKKFSFFGWYEKRRFTSTWTAERRGVYDSSSWRLRTGDGFGLTQVESVIDYSQSFAVFPKLVDVRTAPFMKNLWNADTGTRGVTEDTTVIRSTRDYMTTDSLKRINWRLVARMQPLSVNVYEDILPKSVHFIFDGESFGGPGAHYDELEDALSILASEIVGLSEAGVKCSLSVSQGRDCEAAYVKHSMGTELELLALARYNPLEPLADKNDPKIIHPQAPIFDIDAISRAKQKTGRFYYIAYDTSLLNMSDVFATLDSNCMTVLTYEDSPAFGEYETACFKDLAGGDEQ